MSYLFSSNPRKLATISLKLPTVMRHIKFQLTDVKKRRLTLIVFLGVFILAFYIHFRRIKDTASLVTRIKSSAGKYTLINFFYCNILASSVYIVTRAF